MASRLSEMDTVVKKILPYLKQRGYDIEKELDFETPLKLTTRYQQGYADILVTTHGKKPSFLIEAKKDTKKLAMKDRDQALDYGKSLDIPFVVVTNGREIQCFNVKNSLPIQWNGKLIEKIPTRSQLPKVLSILRTNPNETNIKLEGDESLPFRPALPLKQLNGLFKRCHDAIRNIEKDEENAFSDFSKLLFLRLLEEKADREDFRLPYSFRFYELAKRPESESDQVQTAILDMIRAITRQTQYGEVLAEPLRLKNGKTFLYIVQQLASVSFYDSDLDSKGAAFEYFVRATLKGKNLGQYFTPRPLIRIMSTLVGREKLLTQLLVGEEPKVFDPACGTGGFLVYMMQECFRQVEQKYTENRINGQTREKLIQRLKGNVFFGSDANKGVASAAKMNMIIAGDGHSNITAEDSLGVDIESWSVKNPDCDLILTNPPFGTSESQSLTKEALAQYPIPVYKKGQYLFLQKMILTTKADGEICTVIDEGVLNNDKGMELRRWLLQKCRLKAVVLLPEETFKPNKINVRSSLLYMSRYKTDDIDLEREYPITFCHIKSLGYLGSGEAIRDFDFEKQLIEIETGMLRSKQAGLRTGYYWEAYDINSSEMFADPTFRFDYKYWNPVIRNRIDELIAEKAQTLKSINTVETARGKSPEQDMYVDEKDGYALVVKAGNISKFGNLLLEEADYIEKDVYDRMESAHIQEGDILLASTGEGTLGKCCVYRSDKPAIADGHVTVIRVDSNRVYPEYLCDYLRLGFGAKQIEMLYSGSTGLIELTVEQVNRIVVNIPEDMDVQKHASERLRTAETEYQTKIEAAQKELEMRRSAFE